MAKKNALGRGLGALIEDAGQENQVQAPAAAVNEISIRDIEANPWQPRSKFDEQALDELADSIKEIGIIQPVTVSLLENGKFQLITGERRYRAARKIGLKSVPAFVRNAEDQNMLEMALVENIQREDLDAIEVALSYQRLMEECKLTQEVLSERVGKKRSTISNYLRLLKLPAVIQKAIREREISMGHARAIINVGDPETQVMIYKQIINYDFSVRKVEEIVRKLNSEEEKPAKAKKPVKKFPEEYEKLKNHLSQHFDTNVDFKINNKGKGQIVIPFKSGKDLERIIGILDKLNQ